MCISCEGDNPMGSKYCNKCGIQFPLICSHCGNSNNLPEAIYCNQCGLQVSKEKPMEYGEDVSLQLENFQLKQFNIKDYNEFSLPEYNFKIKYHPERIKHMEKFFL